jgi:hypothetical protein
MRSRAGTVRYFRWREVEETVVDVDFQNSFALLPVAGAQFVRPQRIEYAQHFIGIAAHVEVGHHDKADHVVGINDEGRALGDGFSLIKDINGRSWRRE